MATVVSVNASGEVSSNDKSFVNISGITFRAES
jgi:hypothetical protein